MSIFTKISSTLSRVLSTKIEEEDDRPIEKPRSPPYKTAFRIKDGTEFLRYYNTEACDFELDKLKESSGLTDEEYDLLLKPVLNRFCNYAHFIPASKDTHHDTEGGLLHHSIEVARIACQATKNIDPFKSPLLHLDPKTRRHKRYAWRICMFYGALLHDVGKVVTDVKVFSSDGKHQWNPALSDLYTWAKKNNIEEYNFSRVEGHFGKHERKNPELIQKIVGVKIREYLDDFDRDMFDIMVNAVSNLKDHEWFSEYIKKADAKSCEENKGTRNNNDESLRTDTPVETMTLQAVRNLIHDGDWKINEPGARVFVTNKGTFIPWREGSKDIVQFVKKYNTKGLPIDPTTLSELLVDKKFADRIDVDDLKACVWNVYPECLKRPDGKPIKLSMLKVSNPTSLFSEGSMPEPIRAVLDHEVKDGKVDFEEKQVEQKHTFENEIVDEELDRDSAINDLDELTQNFQDSEVDENPEDGVFELEKSEDKGLFDFDTEEEGDCPFEEEVKGEENSKETIAEKKETNDLFDFGDDSFTPDVKSEEKETDLFGDDENIVFAESNVNKEKEDLDFFEKGEAKQDSTIKETKKEILQEYGNKEQIILVQYLENHPKTLTIVKKWFEDKTSNHLFVLDDIWYLKYPESFPTEASVTAAKLKDDEIIDSPEGQDNSYVHEINGEKALRFSKKIQKLILKICEAKVDLQIYEHPKKTTNKSEVSITKMKIIEGIAELTAKTKDEKKYKNGRSLPEKVFFEFMEECGVRRTSPEMIRISEALSHVEKGEMRINLENFKGY